MLPWAEAERAVETALTEDLSLGDVTTDALVSADLIGKGAFLVKAPGVLAGLEIAALVFRRVDPEVTTEVMVPEGSPVAPGTVVGVVRGRTASILKGERTALNFLTRLSGIATLTASFVKAVEGLPCAIVDTRKTAPGLRALDKYAVRMGGGKNHRYHLGDGVLVKDNHWQALRAAGLSLSDGIHLLRQRVHHLLKIEVEVTNWAEAEEALAAGADVLMLDNMSTQEMKRVVAVVKGKALIEASGGINLDTVRRVAESGVNFISVGALTHSPKALDISLELSARRADSRPTEE